MIVRRHSARTFLGAAGHFTWMRESPDRWTASIFGIGPDGKERITVYPMERIGR